MGNAQVMTKAVAASKGSRARIIEADYMALGGAHDKYGHSGGFKGAGGSLCLQFAGTRS
jgi:hypothetical protein